MPGPPLLATSPTTVRDLIRGEERPAVVLGAFPTAMYLRLAGGDVIALLTRDAVQLPLGLTLSTHSASHPLNRWTGPVLVGASGVQTGDWSVRVSRIVAVHTATSLEPNRRAIAYASRQLGRVAHVGPRSGPLETLVSDQRLLAPAAVVDRLLGVGPGLTPFGDDILAGFLIGASAFGLPEDRLRTAVAEAAPAGTTDLSAALLRCASRGESIPQVTTFLRALSNGSGSSRQLDDALVDLAHVGHTSGTALAVGVVAAARVAERAQTHRPD